MGKLIVIIGRGFLSGAACKLGFMMMDAMFPNGLDEFIAKLKAKNEQNTNN